jgi:hypothetical protein
VHQDFPSPMENLTTQVLMYASLLSTFEMVLLKLMNDMIIALNIPSVYSSMSKFILYTLERSFKISHNSTTLLLELGVFSSSLHN